MAEQMTRSFTREEFTCRCGCGADHISEDLVDNLQHSRDVTGFIYKIVSGVRCEKHNREVGGVPNSEHVKGEAADIECLNNSTRSWMLRDLVRRFRRIGIGKTFIHVDVSKTKFQDVIWTYYP